MLARDFDFQQAAGNVTSKTALEKFHGDRENWLEFCMFPDIVPPVRMPSLFPIPTHIVRRQTVHTITPLAGNINAVWKPHTVQTTDLLTTIPTTWNEDKIAEGYRSGFHYTTNQIVGASENNADNTTNVQPINWLNVFTPSLMGSTGLVHGGARMIGAFIEIEYIGTLDDHAGLIECGLHMHSANTAYDLHMIHGFSQAEIIQAPFYRKFKPMDGLRCVWFPSDDEAFNFQDYDIDSAGTGIGDPNAANQTTAAGISERLRTISLRGAVYPEWGINFTGLTVSQGIRVHMCSFYETVPDEAQKDIYMASKTRNYADVGKIKSAVTDVVQTAMIATPAKSSTGFVALKEKAMQYIDGAQQAYGVFQGMRGALSAIGMFAG